MSMPTRRVGRNKAVRLYCGEEDNTRWRDAKGYGVKAMLFGFSFFRKAAVFAIWEIAFLGESKWIKFNAVVSCACVMRNVVEMQKRLVEGL